MDIPPSFSVMFSKGANFHDFLFAYLYDEVLQKWGILLKERKGKNLLLWEQILVFKS